jgi:hypothetical protein
MKDNGIMTRSMEKECKSGLMEMNIKEITNMAKGMEKVSIYVVMENYM